MQARIANLFKWILMTKYMGCLFFRGTVVAH
jgi:hypothetical protein